MVGLLLLGLLPMPLLPVLMPLPILLLLSLLLLIPYQSLVLDILLLGLLHGPAYLDVYCFPG